jgi:hypothetical protein
VRAPFAAVDVPGRAYYGEPIPVILEPQFVERAFPTAAELAAMSEVELEQALRSIAARLHDRLARFDTGSTWQRYLRLPEEALADSPAAQRDVIANTLNRFYRVASDPQYPMIARLPAFAAMEAALTEALSRWEEGAAPAGTVEDLPLPAPERPARQGREGPFLRPAASR